MTTVTMEEFELMKDSKYRMYVAAVDKALKSFDYTSEWADLISALGKLNKVLLGYTKFPVIPRRIKISKRLAQCMHPALPSGVHLKALETYDIIFKSMGTNRLSNELFIYSSGLFPLLGHAAMNIRPVLLLVYETHFVPLEERLRPALSGFLSGILPGLETGSDHFDRTNTLLENVCRGVGADWFYTCVWQCVRTNSPVRLPAISYILAHYSRKVSMEDQLYLMGNDIDVMVSGLCAAVQDSSVLVQRSALDLLLVCFPMQNTQLLYADMVRLVTASLTTILRRDMSLNRRLYSWILSSENHTQVTTPTSENPTSPVIELPVRPFAAAVGGSTNDHHTDCSTSNNNNVAAVDLLTEGLRVTLKQGAGDPQLDVKPYRLLTSLFERPQIGPLILDVILYDVFRALYQTCLTQQRHRTSMTLIPRCVSFNGDVTSLKRSLLTREFVSKNCRELIKNANVLFNTLQNYYIWAYIARLFERAVATPSGRRNSLCGGDDLHINEIGSGPPPLLELCLLADFLLDIIPLETFVENTIEVLPNLFKKIVTISTDNIAVLNRHEIMHSLTLCTKILRKIQPGTVSQSSRPVVDLGATTSSTTDSLLESCRIADETASATTAEEAQLGDMKSGLEKSKSDSKLNDKVYISNNNELTIDNNARERSNSNQMLKKKEKSSPKIEKKSKSKKSKSSSKLYDMKRDDRNDSNNSVIESSEADSPPPKIAVEKVAKPTPVKPENSQIKSCLEVYFNFFVTFVSTKVIPNVDFDRLFSSYVRDGETRHRELEELLEKCISTRRERITFDMPELAAATSAQQFMRSDSAQRGDCEAAVRVATQLLIEFAAFPNLVDAARTESFSGGRGLPYWLKALTICACTASAGTAVQIVAMNTLMEIFTLTKSQCHQRVSSNTVTMGILPHGHLTYIEESTVVLDVMSRYLWNFLGGLTDQAEITACVTLLYSIHNTFDARKVVEQIIGAHLVDDRSSTEFFKRFYILWHLGRDLNITLTHSAHMKNFDRSLLKILDNLQNPEWTNIRLLSESFLMHSLLRNDTPRIIYPILYRLLAPSTARISIRHVHFADTDACWDVASRADQGSSDDSHAKQIYAISSVNGNVRYHVTTGSDSVASASSIAVKPSSSKKRWFLLSRGGKKYTQVVNMTSDRLSGTSSKKSRFENDQSDKGITTSSHANVKLFINPLGAKEAYTDGVDGSYTRIDPNDKSSPSSAGSSTTSSGNDDDGRNTPVLRLPSSPHYDRSRLFKSQSYVESESATHDFAISQSESDENENNADSDSNHELEISTSAEEFFCQESARHAATSILDEIISDACTIAQERQTASALTSTVVGGRVPETADANASNMPKLNERHVKNYQLFQLHNHLCLYYEVFDSRQILYALRTLRACLSADAPLFIRSLATAGLKDMRTGGDLLQLLARHRKSLLGAGFSGDMLPDYVNFYRGYMFLDVVLLVCLNFARSFYPMLDDARLTRVEIENNLQIQLDSLEILDLVVKNLGAMVVSGSAKGFADYVADVLVKCKLQSVLLHCLLTSVRSFGSGGSNDDEDDELTFAEEVLLFNGCRLYDDRKHMSEYVQAYQTQLLRLTHSVIVLEYHVFPSAATPAGAAEATANGVSVGASTAAGAGGGTGAAMILIPKQEIFLSAIVSALKHQNMKHMHQNWCNMVTSCLPYFQDNLKQICVRVISHVCNNVERIAETYRSPQVTGDICPDYAITQLESLTILVHYCLLDSTQTANPHVPSNTSANNSHNTEILNNLMSAFFAPVGLDPTSATNQRNSDHYQRARQAVLSHMPRIIASVAKLWQTIVDIEPSSPDRHAIFGDAKIVKQQLLEFLSPIAVHHGPSFLAAVAIAWQERRNPFATIKTILPEPNDSQNNLVYLISAIRVIPLDNLVQMVIAVIKNPPPTEGLNSDVMLDVAVLELFYCYMRKASATQLVEAWASLLTLIRDGCALTPPSQFLLAALLYELMIKCCPLEERKDQKDLQDVTAKVIECVSHVCGSCLEQTNWLRRNLAVKEHDDDSMSTMSSITTTSSELLAGNSYSVQAQLVLSEILAHILDICFGSSEKDKVNTILASLMCNIVPYLKAHTIRNMPSFGACSKLLSSLSSYQYTRKAWRKDVFDLLLDNSLFQMEHSCLKYWKIIIDNLMTHDNITFRDLMLRVSMTQSGGLNIFSSREQEYEQRAQLLKRLAFVIFCSEVDQYAKYMPEIQEQLTTSLRISVPGIQAQVFLCFRVLLLRMSPIQVTSLWPIIISEMLQVFIQVEQELMNDSEEFKNNTSAHIKLLTGLDASWATNSNNGLHALGHPHWLRLQLAACKLLDLALLLPATSLPQFQMYRWAFVGDDLDNDHSLARKQRPRQGDGSGGNGVSSFVPHVTRIAQLMDAKYTDAPVEILSTKHNELLLTMNSIKQLRDLRAFFKTLSVCSNRHRTECNGTVSNEFLVLDRQVTDKRVALVLEKLDRVIELDFLDNIPR